MWSDLVSEQTVAANGHGNGHANGTEAEAEIIPLQAATTLAAAGSPIRTPQAQGVGYGGPIHIGQGRMAEHMVQTTYNAQHKVPWHWPVPAYLVSKGIGSGIFALLAVFFGLQIVEFNPLLALAGNFLALLFIGLTTLLLVMDLEKPATFLRIIFRPQMKSWLTRGAFILIGFSAVAGLWLLIEGAAYLGMLSPPVAAAIRLPLLAIGFMLAIGAAIYTAFLFGQAEGRDLWQSTLLPAHLLIQATMVGSAALLVLGLFVPMSPTLVTALSWIFGATLLIDLFVILLGEFGMPHASEVAARAAHEISRGKYRRHFWIGAIGLGHIVPILLLLSLAFGPPIAPLWLILAAVTAIAGLYLFEYAFVMAPQEIPNS